MEILLVGGRFQFPASLFYIKAIKKLKNKTKTGKKMIFANQIGLWALLALIPFILIYLIRPHPRDMVLPSLMFLMKERQVTKRNSFLRRLMRNILFFIQLIALTALALSVAAPSVEIPYSVASDNTVIVLDSSASMQTQLGHTTRFQRAVEEAKGNLGGRVSIILAENMPLTVLKDGDPNEARSVLSKLRPKATTTNIGDAMLLAEDMLKEKKGRIVVISDFLQTQGADLMVVKRALTSKGNRVDFIEVTSEAENVGIIDMELTKHTTKAYIKNFNNKEETVEVRLVKDNVAIGKNEIILLPNSLESLVFDTQTDLSRIELDVKDDLAVDNIVYISAPSKKKIDVLLITSKKKSALAAALGASKDIALSVSHPPLSHMVDGKQIRYRDFDVIVMSDVGKEGDKEGLLKGHFKDMDDFIKARGKLVITSQEGLGDVATTSLSRELFSQMMPVALKTKANRTRLCFKIFNQFTSQFQENVCPAVLDEYLTAEAVEEAAVIATANDNSPLIAYKGDVFYYGIIDDKSDFKTLSYYPIFWNELINFLVRTEDIKDYNFKAGDLVAIKEQEVKTPTTNMLTSKLILDEHGVYEFDEKRVAVNLLNEDESDVAKESETLKEDTAFDSGREMKRKKIELEIYLIALVLILLFVEVIYIKQRGDL